MLSISLVSLLLWSEFQSHLVLPLPASHFIPVILHGRLFPVSEPLGPIALMS